MSLDANVRVILEIIALFGVVVGPAIAYLAAKRKIGAEVRLIDIETIKGWSEQRKNFEREIAELHQELSDEQDRRRADRATYHEQIEDLYEQLSVMRKKLNRYEGLDDYE